MTINRDIHAQHCNQGSFIGRCRWNDPNCPVMPGPVARPLSEWTKGDGPVLWYKFPVDEPPWCGTPNDTLHTIDRRVVSGWPGYHTHWTPLGPTPKAPAASVDALANAAPDMLIALKYCTRQFRFYAENHAKNGEYAKEATDTEFAILCEEEIEKAEGRGT